MNSLTVRTTADADGTIRLCIPLGFPGAEYEVVVRPVPAPVGPPPTPEELGWPPGYFEATYGSSPDFGLDPKCDGEHLNTAEG